MHLQFFPLPSNQTLLEPGKHTYSFSIPLQDNLPGAIQTAPGNALGWKDIVSTIEYAVEVCIRPKGQSKTKVITRLPLIVHAAPLPPAKHPGSATTDTTTSYVVALCCIYRGKCELTLSTDCDTTDIGSGQLHLRATIKNGTSVGIRGITLSLDQSVTMYIPEKFSHAGCRAGWSHTLLEQNFDHEVPPKTTTEDFMMTLSMLDVLAHQRGVKTNPTGKEFVTIPNSSLFFVTIRYRVTAKIIFASAAVNAIEADLPVTLLHVPGHNSSPRKGTVAPLTMLAKPAASSTGIQLASKPALMNVSKVEASSSEPVSVAQVEIRQAS